MSSVNLGNQLNAIVALAKRAMFEQGELAQLTYGAFDVAASSAQQMQQEEIELTFPLGYKPDKTTIPGHRKYSKDQLVSKYRFLAVHQLRDCKDITACTVDRRVVRCARGVGYPAGKACSAGARAHGAIAPGVGGD